MLRKLCQKLCVRIFGVIFEPTHHRIQLNRSSHWQHYTAQL